MRVLVIGGGGREQAIAWACRHHGHDVRLAPDLGDASPDDTDLVFPGPEAALVGRRCRRVCPSQHPVLRADRRTRTAGVVEDVRP